MLIPTSSVEFSLQRRQILVFHDAAGFALRVLSGILWVTQDRDSSDAVVEPGQTFVIARQGKTVISALRDARVFGIPALREQPPERVRAPASQGAAG